MKVIINLTKPLYFDEINQEIRCGNFPETGKVLNYEDENFIKIFKEFSSLVDVKSLENKATRQYSIVY